MNLEKNSWKKREVGKFEVRKFPFKFESTIRSWKVSNAVLSKQKYSNFGSNFPTSIFPISFRTLQLLVFSNYIYPRSHNRFSEGGLWKLHRCAAGYLQVFHTKNFTDISVRLFVWLKKLIFIFEKISFNSYTVSRLLINRVVMYRWS